ncbi:zinc finger protein 883 [Drosophila biarmipes]|uniref:zinc finger protein 883 n=1 Tax=Drosophila biarmipes TaxID=125945 RepID=UPI0007E86931|nr:zinc finger protein 883 [Drosophila biarmipes]
MEEICRVCLGHYDDMVNIFEGTLGLVPSIPDMIAEWSGYRVEKGDSLPESICLGCLEDAQNAFEIQQTSEMGHQLLCQVKAADRIGNALRKEEYFTISDSESEASRTGHPLKDTAFAANPPNKETNAQQFDSPTVELNSLEDELCRGQPDPSMYQFSEDSNSKISVGDVEPPNGYVQDEVCEISDDETKSSDCQIQEDAKGEVSVKKDESPHSKVGNNDMEDNEGRPHKCPLCAKTFARHCSYKNHLRTHAEDADSASEASTYIPSDKRKGPRKSDPAQESVKDSTSSKSDDEPYRPNQSGAEQYKRVDSSERPFQCKLCQKTFQRKAGVIVHLRVHTGERPYKCSLCPSAFKQQIDVKRHMLTHTKERPHKCHLCDMDFTHPSALKVHLLDHKGERPFKCKRCPKTFRFNACLKIHMRDHTGERPYKCGKCSKSFKLRIDLGRHPCSGKRYELKQIRSRMPRKKPLLLCDFCPKVFVHKSSLTVHLRVHTVERPYKCDQCTSTFKHRIDLKRHMSTHTKERPYKCSQCDATFWHHLTLKVHVRDHSGLKPYKCDHCPKAFRYRTSLKAHIDVHSKEKSYDCDECHRRFTHLSNLKRHRTMGHNRNFKVKNNLEEHLKTHSSEKPFKCNRCQRTFKMYSSFKAHKSVHIGEKPHKCPYCSKVFAYQASLTSHIRSHSKL